MGTAWCEGMRCCSPVEAVGGRVAARIDDTPSDTTKEKPPGVGRKGETRVTRESSGCPRVGCVRVEFRWVPKTPARGLSISSLSNEKGEERREGPLRDIALSSAID